MKLRWRLTSTVFLLFLASGAAQAQKKPNILVIWGDDIGWYNPSIYSRGDMGYQTFNIDRIGKRGWVPDAVSHPLAGRDQTRNRLQRFLCARGFPSDLRGGSQRYRRRGAMHEGVVVEFEKSVKKYPPIPSGTPDPYTPPNEEGRTK